MKFFYALVIVFTWFNLSLFAQTELKSESEADLLQEVRSILSKKVTQYRSHFHKFRDNTTSEMLKSYTINSGLNATTLTSKVIPASNHANSFKINGQYVYTVGENGFVSSGKIKTFRIDWASSNNPYDKKGFLLKDLGSKKNTKTVLSTEIIVGQMLEFKLSDPTVRIMLFRRIHAEPPTRGQALEILFASGMSFKTNTFSGESHFEPFDEDSKSEEQSSLNMRLPGSENLQIYSFSYSGDMRVQRLYVFYNGQWSEAIQFHTASDGSFVQN